MKPGNQMALAIEHMCDAVLEYNGAYEREFDGAKVGSDGVLGEAVADVLRGARQLLNGPLGWADGGKMDRRICAVAAHIGLNPEDI